MRYDPQAALAALRTATAGRPVVIGQLGQSLDGRIATPTGKSKYISGRRALAHLHRLRASVDAVVVGVETVIADDPQLTVRLVDGPSPARVIIDPRGRMPTDLRLLHDGRDDVLVVRAAGAAGARTPAGRAEIVEVQGRAQGGQARDEQAQDGPAKGGLPPAAIIAALGARGFRRILIEGGSETLSRMIAAGVVDQLHVMVAPVILGSGKPGLSLPPIDELDEGVHPAAQVFAFDDGDALFVCDLRRARAAAADPAALDAPTLPPRVTAAE